MPKEIRTIAASFGKAALLTGTACVTYALGGPIMQNVCGGILTNIASNWVENAEYKKLRTLISAPHPSKLNHHLENLILKALNWSLKNIQILYKNELGFAFREKELNTTIRQLIQEIEHIDLKILEEYALIVDESTESQLNTVFDTHFATLPVINPQRPFPDFLKAHFLDNFQLCFGELLKLDEFKEARHAYMRSMQVNILQNTNQLLQQNDNLQNELLQIKEAIQKIDINEASWNLDENLGELFQKMDTNIQLLIGHSEKILEDIDQVKETTLLVDQKADTIIEELSKIRNAQSAQQEELTTLTEEQLFDSVPLVSQQGNWGIELVKYYNEQVKLLYKNKVYGNKDVSFDPKIWDEIFDNDEFEAQKNFVETITTDNQEVKYYSLNLLGEKEERIWLIGEAGVGKTTTLYSIYFTMLLEPDKYPIPMLIQPQEFDSFDIAEFKSTENILESVLIIWLQNRSLLSKKYKSDRGLLRYKGNAKLQQIVSTIVNALKSGEIIILIDSFDELSRMSFQIDVFKKIFKSSRKYICASRPETYLQHLHQHISIKIRSPWALPTIKKYLDQKLALAPGLKNGIYRYIESNVHIDWLKNPRYLNLLIDLIYHNHKNATTRFEEKEISDFLAHGEYALFHKIFDAAFERINRYFSQRGLEADKHKVEHMLTQVAIGQLHDGNYTLYDDKKLEEEHYWQAILTESSLIRRRVRTNDNTGEVISLLNHNLVDYYISDDISNQILNTKDAETLISFNQLWTHNLLKYVSSHLWEKCDRNIILYDEVVDIIWMKIQNRKIETPIPPSIGFRKHEVSADFSKQYQAINLVQLLIQFEIDRISKTNKSIEKNELRVQIHFEYRTNFANLNLANTDLSAISFSNCDFTGSILYNTNLKNTKFVDCIFDHVNLKRATAESAIFENCIFNFDQQTEDSPIQRLLIKGAVFKQCRLSRFGAVIDVDFFLKHGAIDFGSRYTSKFGKDFLKNQKKYLGPGLAKAENYYMNEIIIPILDQLEKEKTRSYLIDLMAGGNNDRITEFFKSRHNLHALAIDKNTEELKPIQVTIGDRFKVVKKEISGKIDLQAIVKDLFNSTLKKYAASWGFASLIKQVDLIIGKKAIHEITRSQQIELLKDCFNALKPNGHLTLFTDSPIAISPRGYKKLVQLKSVVIENKSYDEIRSSLIDELEFGDSLDDVAIFSNLWVLLKDWANGNKSEVKRRYFSSINEIIEWGEQIGFEVETEPFRAYYDLTAKFFNEHAFNQIELLLERSQNDHISEGEKNSIYEYLQGTDKHKIFFEFAEHHLFHKDGLTDLGTKLNARKTKLHDKYREVNPRLTALKIPYREGACFQFSVHVVKFLKPDV